MVMGTIFKEVGLLKKSFKLKSTSINLAVLDTYLPLCQTLKQFSLILSQVIVSGFIKDTYAASRLLKFSTDLPFIHVKYSFCIFNLIQTSNCFIWNTMMRAYVQRNCPQKAVYLYKFMLRSDVSPDNYTYPILLQACTIRLSQFEGKHMHDHVVKTGFSSDVYVRNTLIHMYAACENMMDARKLFDESPIVDLVSWNSILAGYIQILKLEEAVFIYNKMPERNIIASNSMIVLLGRTGLIVEAYQLFKGMSSKDMVSWSAMIACYEQNKMYEEALVMFKEMKSSGMEVDKVVVVTVLSACANFSSIWTGKLIHNLAVKIGIESYVNLQNALIHMYSCCGEIVAAQSLFNASYHLDQITWNSMISGYLKCGSVKNAKTIFDSMPEKDIVSWSTIISGYAQHDHFSETLALFHEMQLSGIRPDETTLVSVISACSHLGSLDQGKWVHAYVRKNALKVTVILGTTLVDMYMKCGCVENAMDVFNGMEEKGISTWNALILGLAMNGLVEESLDMFSKMKKCDITPNEITFMAVLGACRHMGLVDEGRSHFKAMTEEYKIQSNVKHYNCMVDLLGRAGMLKEAEEFMDNMPMKPDVATWGALLGACKKHGNHEMGERVGRKLTELKPDNHGFLVLLSNIYASNGNWDNVFQIRGMIRQHGLVKTPGCSMIEVNGIVHEFLAGDRTHPMISNIMDKLEEMAKKLKMEGYAPVTSEVSLDIDEEEKETALFRHSEKLAIAFGLITINPPTPIRIMKNLRICNDCHTAAKLISRAFDRVIVVRDRHRFHHFSEGSCSCMDYW